MQQPEIDSAVFCDGAHYTIISRENSSILTCPVTSGAGGYTLNRVEGRDIDREIDRLTGHAACIAVDVPTWCRIAGDPLDAVADALADLLTEAPTRFELERLAAASPVLTANTPGIPVFPAGIAPAANSYTLAGCCRSALVRGLSSPELYRTALTAAGAAISGEDRSIEDGWETISAIIDEDALDLGLSTRQGVDFYRDAFGHWNSTEAIVWPNSEGDAAFVMAVPADSEDGDLAVYKIDACLIGDDEITVDDIERLGGKRELCVYKHGFDGIEAIRNFANRVAVDRFDERFVVNNLYGELPDLAPTLRKVTEGARTAAQEPRDPQAIAAAALSAAEGGANGAVEHVGNKH